MLPSHCRLKFARRRRSTALPLSRALCRCCNSASSHGHSVATSRRSRRRPSDLDSFLFKKRKAAGVLMDLSTRGRPCCCCCCCRFWVQRRTNIRWLVQTIDLRRRQQSGHTLHRQHLQARTFQGYVLVKSSDATTNGVLLPQQQRFAQKRQRTARQLLNSLGTFLSYL